MRFFAIFILCSILFVVQVCSQSLKTTSSQNLQTAKIQEIAGSVFEYYKGQKRTLSKNDEIVSPARFEVVDGVVEFLLYGNVLTATAGADFDITHKPDFLRISSNQGVPIEINTTSGHNLVLTSRADVEIIRTENKIQVSVKSQSVLMSDLKGKQETRILNAPYTITVSDMGLVRVESRIKKERKRSMDEFFKRFTKEEFEFFSLHTTDLKDLVFTDEQLLNNELLGKISYLKYFIASSMHYDGNIYLTNILETPAYINQSSAGIKFKQGFERSYVYGGYILDLLTYSKQQSANNAVHHSADVGFKIKFPNNFTVALEENFIATTHQENSEITFRTKRTSNDFKFFTDFPISGKLGFRADFAYLSNNYLASAFNFLDRAILSTGGGFTYWFLPETLMYAHYGYSNLDYDGSSTHNAKAHKVGLTIERQLSPELVGKIGVAMEFRNYDTNYALLANSAENNPATFIFNAQAAWKPYSNSRMILIAERKNVETNLNTTSELSRYYESTLIDLSWLHKINEFDFGLGFGWEFADYPQNNISISKKRSDRYSSFRTNVSYRPTKWLILTADYGFTARTSNITANEYDRHTGGISAKALF